MFKMKEEKQMKGENAMKEKVKSKLKENRRNNANSISSNDGVTL